MDKEMVALCNSAVEGENFDWVRDYFVTNPGVRFCFESGRFLIDREGDRDDHHHVRSYEEFIKLLPDAVLSKLTQGGQNGSS